MVFLWFSYGFPIKTSIFLWFSYGFPMVFLWFYHGLRISHLTPATRLFEGANFDWISQSPQQTTTAVSAHQWKL